MTSASKCASTAHASKSLPVDHHTPHAPNLPPENRSATEVAYPLSDGQDSPDALSEALGTFSQALIRYLAARNYLNALAPGTRIEEEDRASAAFMDAEHCLMRTAAPNLSALRAKFDVLLLDPNAIPSRDYTLALFADFQRLTGGRVSHLFEPERWLQWFGEWGGAYCVRGDEIFLLQPKGTDLGDHLFELEASGGKEAVFDLIRSRTAMEAVDGRD